MTKVCAVVAAISAAFLVGPVFAADRPVPLPPIAPPVVVKPASFTWTGHYIGLHCGAAWGRTFSTDGDDAVTVSPVGGVCGGQLGSNWQHGHLVFGVEGELGYLFLQDTNIVDAGGADDEQFVARVRYGGYGTLTARLGIAHDHSLFYLKGGAAFARITNTWTEYEVGVQSEFSKVATNRTGWVLGGGWEHAVNAKWSWKLEYLHMDFGTTETTSDGEPLTHANVVQTLKLGVNFRF